MLIELHHENLVAGADLFEDLDGKNIYIVEELCDESIENYLNSNENNFSMGKVLELFRQICLGVNVLHERNIIHRE